MLVCGVRVSVCKSFTAKPIALVIRKFGASAISCPSMCTSKPSLKFFILKRPRAYYVRIWWLTKNEYIFNCISIRVVIGTANKIVVKTIVPIILDQYLIHFGRNHTPHHQLTRPCEKCDV